MTKIVRAIVVIGLAAIGGGLLALAVTLGAAFMA